MNHLWSPWRMEYIKNKKDNSSCVFCDVLEQEDGWENLIIYRGVFNYAILNRYPYNTGHALIIPYRHVASYELLTPEERAEMMELVNKVTKVLRQTYHPNAFNIGANIGEAAGAGIAPHVHFHVLPRWYGDTNFVTTIGQTRIVPENLSDTYDQLKKAWNEIFCNP
ncbi:MAG: HIT domain-containing protein [Anaerolineaceae bacterium]|nr:HIT domain-containing protein [Anaerolineaceae bacterium]